MSVNLYHPETLQGSVWKESDAPKMIAKGYLTEEEYLAVKEAEDAEAHQKWLISPDTIEERFQMLRIMRDNKVAATDYMQTLDYPLNEEKRTILAQYRQALRDLPAQEGAPWDGGGKLTPWPVAPEFIKN